MKKFIENMQRRSEAEKRTFAFWAATIMTLFIFGIWFVSTWTTISQIQDGNISNEASAFSSFFNQIKDIVTTNKEVYQAE